MGEKEEKEVQEEVGEVQWQKVQEQVVEVQEEVGFRRGRFKR